MRSSRLIRKLEIRQVLKGGLEELGSSEEMSTGSVKPVLHLYPESPLAVTPLPNIVQAHELLAGGFGFLL